MHTPIYSHCVTHPHTRITMYSQCVWSTLWYYYYGVVYHLPITRQRVSSPRGGHLLREVMTFVDFNCSYQCNISYGNNVPMIFLQFLKLGTRSEACFAGPTGCPSIALPLGAAHPFGKLAWWNLEKVDTSPRTYVQLYHTQTKDEARPKRNSPYLGTFPATGYTCMHDGQCSRSYI